MATISASIKVFDGMTQPIRSMLNATNMLVSGFESMQNASSHSIDTSSLMAARDELASAGASLSRMEGNITSANQRQQQFNNSLRAGGSEANALTSGIKNMVGAYASLQGAKTLLGLSDTMASTDARLNLIVDDGGSVDDLRNKIFASAQDSRAAYTDTAAAIAKLGILAGDSFSGNDEIIAFTEQMNKNFVIGGAGAMEKASAMYQLTQAMAAGKLQGDEYRSITENAPLLAKSIEDYMVNVRGATGSMKDWSAEGKLTTDVIKTAMFNMTDEVNERFNSMPMTWSQVWTGITNRLLMASRPLLNFINILANNWSIIQPVILGIAAAILIYNAVMGIGWLLTLQNIIAKVADATATVMATVALVAMTFAQQGLNAALAMCPITWIIVAIIVLITILYVAVAALNKWAGTSLNATGMVCGAFMVALAFIGNLLVGFCNLSYDIFGLIWNHVANFVEFFANVFNDPIGSIVRRFAGMADSVLGILETIASAIDTLFGSNLADAVSGWRSALKGMVTDLVGEAEIKVPRIDTSAMHLDRFKYSDAWDSGNDFGKNLSSKFNLGELDNKDPLGDSIGNVGSVLDGIEGNTGKMADSMDITEEDLKYLRDIAERDVINRFTTAEVKVEMSNTFGDIRETADIDGIMTAMETKAYETLISVAEGVHE